MGFSCGIDFGTSNTVFTLINSAGMVVDSFTLPTIFFIYAESQGVSRVEIGEKAVSTFMDHNDGRIIHSIKKSFANPHYRNTRVNNTLLSVEDLLSLFVKEFHKLIMDRYTFIPPRIILGRPVSFSADPSHHQLALDRLEKGFQMGGFEDFEFLEEPIGAYLSLQGRLEKNCRQILVCDFGAGTSDFTLLDRMSSGKISILGKRGIDLGGNEYDSLILTQLLAKHFGTGAAFNSFDKWLPFPEHYLNALSRWSNVFYLNRKQAIIDLRELLPSVDKTSAVKRLMAIHDKKKNYEALLQAQDSKHQLQDTKEADFDFQFLGEEKTVILSQADYHEASRTVDLKILQTARSLVDEFLDNPGRLDTLVFTGGSSKLKSLQESFHTEFPEAKIIFDENFYNSISRGLALYAHNPGLIS
ncbi:MAG: hypothetical protein JEZ04_06490 [Spirochaetales bacterium]|nr:hypothetical protein [Spirochaetales bacterium]